MLSFSLSQVRGRQSNGYKTALAARSMRCESSGGDSQTSVRSIVEVMSTQKPRLQW